MYISRGKRHLLQLNISVARIATALIGYVSLYLIMQVSLLIVSFFLFQSMLYINMLYYYILIINLIYDNAEFFYLYANT